MRTRTIAVTAITIALASSSLAASTLARVGLTGQVIGSLSMGAYDEGATEIVAFDPEAQVAFSTNGETEALDVIDLADPTAPSLLNSIELGGSPTSVAVANGIAAVAVLGEEQDAPGRVVFVGGGGAELGSVEVGVHPDMVTFTPDGMKVLTADEGEPSDDYTADGPGSVTIVDLAAGPENATAAVVGFADFDEGGARSAELDPAVRVYGPGASVSMDLEPEYVAVSPDGSTAWVSLQENNALAVIDIAGASVTAIVPLGTKDFAVTGAGIDASNEDGAINVTTWPARGMYMPDGMATYEVYGTTYLVTANEGDSRDYEDEAGYTEESDTADLALDAEIFPDAAALQAEGNLGKLEVSTASGDTDGDGDWDEIHAFGARSITVWDPASASVVWDSGDSMEQSIAESNPEHFNASNDTNELEDRSDNAGPEPEGLVLGAIGERAYAFVGAERQSGVFVYDITDPTAGSLVTYLENRDWTAEPDSGEAGDLGPEGLVFIPAADSPTSSDLLLVANETSGTLTVWQLTAG
jgi:YVTN family beta-propeller protein